MIMIFTGNGKGKTTAAIGTSLRALGNLQSATIIQSLKTGKSSEIKFLEKNTKHLIVKSFGKSKLTDPKNLTKEDYALAQEALNYTKKSVLEKPFLLILDEILVALKFGLIQEVDIIKIIDKCKSKKIHLLLTGRGATKSLIKKADLVTEMRCIKHPFEKGMKAVKGIDY